MPFNLSSKPAACSAATTEVTGGPVAPDDALRGVLAEAACELALLEGNYPDTEKKYARAAHWVGQLVPAWRELSSLSRQSPLQPIPAVDSSDVGCALRLIDGFLAVLAARTPETIADQQRHAAIEKAKQEWECTADALTSMVCLLDSDGIVLRSNRVVEHWMLGSVSGVIGKKAHTVLHSGCTDPQCEVALGLFEALPRLRRGEAQEFECYSTVSDQTLQFTLRPMRTDDDVNAEPPDSRFVLVVTDVSTLRRAQKAIEHVNLTLESRVRLRTRELDESNRDLRNEVQRREHAEHALTASCNNLALLSEQLIHAQEGERRRIAVELHDSVGQSLSAIKYTLERALIMVQRPNLGSPESVLTLAVQRIQETADGIRAISMNLRPQILDTLGAASATTWFCRNFAEIYSTITMRTEITAKDSEIPKRISTHLFRCVQELLNNVAKHAEAKNIWVLLKRQDSLLSLEVRDDGLGIPTEAENPTRSSGSGIRNLRERADMTCGQFAISSLPGRGASAKIVWLLGFDEATDTR